ncbi:hypothetical protein [Roseomonas sp. BN140053]|uniref:hypothetical protein n=1 Tax=Roseomonas sp. BN140053 TaxID=3391898 RepID=UPI0039EC4822
MDALRNHEGKRVNQIQTSEKQGVPSQETAQAPVVHGRRRHPQSIAAEERRLNAAHAYAEEEGARSVRTLLFMLDHRLSKSRPIAPHAPALLTMLAGAAVELRDNEGYEAHEIVGRVLEALGYPVRTT